jgi:hypothetical protein
LVEVLVLKGRVGEVQLEGRRWWWPAGVAGKGGRWNWIYLQNVKKRKRKSKT